MANKIERFASFPISASDVAICRRKPDSQSSVTGVKAGGNVRLSDEVVDTRNALIDDPSVDHEKVERLRAAIAAGNYHPNPQAIAQRLMEMEEFFGG